MNKVEFIKNEEKKYHKHFYDTNKLFEPGTWLHKPVKTVMDVLEKFNDSPYLSVLDLGSGVGRNSIPIAQSLKHRNGKVVCVDLLDSAIEHLKSNSKEYGVDQFIFTYKTEIELFRIDPLEYDFIVSVSALEHISTINLCKESIIVHYQR